MTEKSVCFVVGELSPLERARGSALVGPAGKHFAAHYLAPLGLTRDEIVVKSIGDLTDSDRTLPCVALGKLASITLGSRAIGMLPHPQADLYRVESGRASDDFSRRLRSVCKLLSIVRKSRSNMAGSELTTPADAATVEASNSTVSDGRVWHSVTIAKDDSDKRIIASVVLDPYTIDAHKDWIPPGSIEDSAHTYLTKSRVVGFRHQVVADAEVVESFIVPYPTRKDYRLALAGEAHRAFRQPYGNDTIHSGAWIIAIKLGSAEWALYSEGKLNAVSIGQPDASKFTRTEIETSDMPEVEFIDLVPKTQDGSFPDIEYDSTPD